MRPLPGELLETRVRPTRASRWRHAVQPGILVAWGLLASVLSIDGVGWLPGIGPRHPALVALVMLPPAVAGALLARRFDRAEYPPVLVTCTAAVAVMVLGVQGPLAFAFQVAGGLVWLAALDAWRVGIRIDLTTHGVIAQTGWMARPVRFLYSELTGVEARKQARRGDWGTLSLMTEHGLFPIVGLPGVRMLERRILTRIQSGEPAPHAQDAAGVADRVRGLLASQ